MVKIELFMINQEKFNLTDKRFERKFILRDLNNIEIISLFIQNATLLNSFLKEQLTYLL